MSVAEAGRYNSVFALALELLTHLNVDVHVASFPILRKRAEELSSSAGVVERKHPASTFTFQEISGMSLREACEPRGLAEDSWPHPPLARTRDKGLDTLITMMTSLHRKGTTCYFWLPLATRTN